MYPNVKAVFVDTGLEYPEIRQFVKTFDNVDWIKPKMNFKAVIQKYGYPFISKEVSECVYGARRYLTSILEQASLDRQTDRQTEPAYRYRFEKLCGSGEFSTRIRTINNSIKHGLPSHYRQFSNSASDGDPASDRQSDSGEYP
jgi:hypothetical protein